MISILTQGDNQLLSDDGTWFMLLLANCKTGLGGGSIEAGWQCRASWIPVTVGRSLFSCNTSPPGKERSEEAAAAYIIACSGDSLQMARCIAAQSRVVAQNTTTATSRSDSDHKYLIIERPSGQSAAPARIENEQLVKE
jgi:hypothetical protein